MTSDKAQSMLIKALEELHRAEISMMATTVPTTQLGRYKTYTWIHPGVVWPHRPQAIPVVKPVTVTINNSPARYDDSTSRIFVAATLAKLCRYQPRRILRVLYRIMATTKWCQARAEGRKRAALEIIRQQQAAVTALEEIAAMSALGELGT